jgi:hypothetical protein
MTKSHFLLDVRPRDADAPGHHDLHLDIDQLMRELRGEPCLDRLCRKMGMTRGEVLKTFTPGAYVDPGTGKASINAGYNPDFDEGALETMIWSIVSHEVGCALAGDTPRPSARTFDPNREPTMDATWAVKPTPFKVFIT